jgi:hypothetical protein
MRARWKGWRALWSGHLDWLRRDLPALAPGGYWARRAQKPGARELHVPLAADIARTSATLVAGDTPAMKWEGDPAAQDAWNTLADEVGWANLLLEAFEVASATGGAYLRPAWDETVADHPLGQVVAADEALAEFRFGRLRQVTFVTELPAPDGWNQLERGEVWRHLEHHEPGQIRHELWLGNLSNVGSPRPLADHPAVSGLPGVIDTTSIRRGRVLCEYIPNDLPNPLTSLPVGRSDLQGVETLLDALDEVFDSWMRDIQLAKARILASREAMDPVAQSSTGGGVRGFLRGRATATPARAFDTDADVFQWMDIPGEDTNGKPMPFTLVQFEIRFEAHERSALALFEQIVSRAGFAPQTFGLNVDGQLSGTAMKRRDIRSHQSKDRKRRYGKGPVERFAETLMLIGKAKFGTAGPSKPPALEWKETSQADPLENAQVIELLRRAQAASDEVVVRMAHGDWDDDQVDEELGRLAKAREAMTAPMLDGTEPPPNAVPPAQDGPPTDGEE